MTLRFKKFVAIALGFFTCACFHVLADDNWISLFNGKDLSGWTQKTGTAKYFVEDGCIVGETVVPGKSTNSFLCTMESYDNFELELDFKADPRINSGVQFRGEYASEPRNVEWQGKTINVPRGYVFGYQAEIDPDVPRKRMWTAGIYDERRRSWMFPSDGEKGEQGKAFSAQGMKIFKPNDWNHLRIVAAGDQIRTYLNDVPCASIEDSMTTNGFIGLQVHASNDASHNGAQVRFKNIRLKKNPAAPSKLRLVN
jgi:hypothetical protein